MKCLIDMRDTREMLSEVRHGKAGAGVLFDIKDIGKSIIERIMVPRVAAARVAQGIARELQRKRSVPSRYSISLI